MKICRNCVDELGGGDKSEKINNVGSSTVYETVELDEDEEEVEGTVLGGGVDEVSIIPVVYPYGTVIVSSLSFFHMLVILLNLLVPPFLSLS